MFFDLVSNIQGDGFFLRKFLNRALFDYLDDLKWTVEFDDFTKSNRDSRTRILLDHILFTQALVDGSLPWKINEHAGKVEHEIHDLINAVLPANAQTSDHSPPSQGATTRYYG